MSLTVSNKGDGGNYSPIPEGSYLAVCSMVVDLGVQYNEKFGKSSRKVLIGWEIPDETIDVNGEEMPKMISKQYTASLNEKSALYKDLIAWRGKAFTPAELAKFDLHSIIGTSCMLNIIHREGSNGKTYTNISSIMALPKGMPKGELKGYATTFDLDTDDLSRIENLPGWIGDIVKRSETYMDRLAAQVKTESAAPQFTELEGDQDDLPF